MVNGHVLPDWFVAATSAEPIAWSVDVDGAKVQAFEWGPADAPAVLFVHGLAANAHWWSHLVPLLAGGRRVVAMDLTGHGDSGWRPSYSLATWRAEVAAVAEQFGPRPVLVGHSMGGHVCAGAALDRPGRYGGLVTCETFLRPPGQPPRPRPALPPRRGGRAHPTKEALVERFRPMPAQAGTIDYIARRVAELSAREEPDGWRWKLDPDLFATRDANPILPAGRAELARLDCPLAVIVAEHGLEHSLTGGRPAGTGWPVEPIEIAAAGHHPMLDQPVALLATLRAVLATWPRR